MDFYIFCIFLLIISALFFWYTYLDKQKEKHRKKDRKLFSEMQSCVWCPGAHMTLHKKQDHLSSPEGGHCICPNCVSTHKIHRKLPLPIVHTPELPCELTIISIMSYLIQLKVRKSVINHCRTFISKPDMTLVTIIQEMIKMGTEIDRLGTKDEYANSFEIAGLAAALITTYPSGGTK